MSWQNGVRSERGRRRGSAPASSREGRSFCERALLGVPRSRAAPRQRNGGVIAGTPSRQGGYGVKAATGGRSRSGAASAAERSAPRSPAGAAGKGEPTRASGFGRRDGRKPRGVSRARRREAGVASLRRATGRRAMGPRLSPTGAPGTERVLPKLGESCAGRGNTPVFARGTAQAWRRASGGCLRPCVAVGGVVKAARQGSRRSDARQGERPPVLA